MSFFTSDLVQRHVSANGNGAQFSREWNEQLGEYQRHLESIQQLLPADLRECVKAGDFLDGDVLARSKLDGHYFIHLRPKNNANVVMSLMYHLTADCEIPPDAALSCGEGIYWLRDEVDVIDRDRPVFSHVIHFSDGLELRLQFTHFALDSLPEITQEMLDEARSGPDFGELIAEERTVLVLSLGDMEASA